MDNWGAFLQWEHEEHKSLHKSVAKLDEHLAGINTTLAAQHVILKEHIRRTEALEKAIRPVLQVSAFVKVSAKIIGLLALIGGIIEVVLKLLEYLHK